MRTLLFLAAALLLASCETVNVPPPHPLSFKNYSPIYLKVGQIQINDEYQPSRQLPHVEEFIPISPTDATHTWVDDRLRATGGSNTLEVIIHDASVTATPLPQQDGLFTGSPDKRYDARLTVEMRLYTGGAMSEASVEAAATRSLTIPGNVSLVQRDAMLHQFIAAMMVSINAELEKNIYKYFAGYIDYSKTP